MHRIFMSAEIGLPRPYSDKDGVFDLAEDVLGDPKAFVEELRSAARAFCNTFGARQQHIAVLIPVETWLAAEASAKFEPETLCDLLDLKRIHVRQVPADGECRQPFVLTRDRRSPIGGKFANCRRPPGHDGVHSLEPAVSFGPRRQHQHSSR